MARVGETYDSKYSLDEEFTPGSVGQSYLCRSDTWPDKKLVLKTIHPDFLHMPGFSQSFGLVAKSLANLKIPQLVPVIELGKYNGELYYVSPFIEGKSLRRWMKETLNFEERILTGLETLKKLSQLLKKMQEADCYAYLKPENILLHEGHVYLKEFWIAGYIPVTYFEKNTAAAHYLPYVAPELKEDWGSNTSSGHCYALGAMLYEILVGKAPLGKYKLPSAYSNIYNREVDKIILNFLAPNPDQRISKLEDIQKALNQLLLTFIPTKNKRPDIEDEWHEQSLGEQAAVSHVGVAAINKNISTQSSFPSEIKDRSPSAMDSLRAMDEDFENEDDDIDTQVIDHLALKRQLKEKEEQENELEAYPAEEETKQMPPIIEEKEPEPEIVESIESEDFKSESEAPKQDNDDMDAHSEEDYETQVENDVFASPLEDNVVETPFQNNPAPDILKSAPTGLKKQLVEQPLNEEIEKMEEEEDYPPVPLAVKLVLAIVGVTLVGGAVFLGFLQALPWK